MNFDRPPFPNSDPKAGKDIFFANEFEAMVIPRAYEKAARIIEEQALKPEMFADTYSEKLLENCANYVSNCESQFDHIPKSDMLGVIIEAMLHDSINKGVFGDDVRGVKTAKFDDYFSGIDEVFERYNDNGTTLFGCAVDFTFGHPEHKITKICDHIKSGILDEITFYESPFGDPPHIHGKIQGIPKFVIGIDMSHLLQMSEKWIREDDDTLKDHQIFLLMLRQIQQQAEVFSAYARKFKQENVAERYEQVGAIFSKLYNELKSKRGIIMLDSSITKDQIHQEVRDKLSEVMKFIDS